MPAKIHFESIRRSEGCTINAPHYAGTTKKVNGNAIWTGKLAMAGDQVLLQPLHRRKPTTYFVNSMGDLFHEDVPDEWIDKVFAVMALAPQHTFQVLTKRAERMRAYLTAGKTVARSDIRNHLAWNVTIDVLHAWAPGWTHEEIDGRHRSRGIQAFKTWPLPNVWLGVSTERQQEADERIRSLLDTPAAVRFISAEPLLGPIDLTRLCILPQKPGSVRAGIHLNALAGRYCESGVPYTGDWDINGPSPPVSERRKLDWVIVGGESGRAAREPHPAWVRYLRDQCAAADVPFFFKQWGQFVPMIAPAWHEQAGVVNYYNPTMKSVGKKAAGRLLDGIEHNGMPEIRS